MTARRHAVAAAVTAALAVLLWWLSRGSIEVVAPTDGAPLGGTVPRTVTDTRLLLAATVSAGLAMVFATLWILSSASRPAR